MCKYEGYNITYNNKRYKVRYINHCNTVWLTPIVCENEHYNISGGIECCISIKELEDIITDENINYYI